MHLLIDSWAALTVPANITDMSGLIYKVFLG